MNLGAGLASALGGVVGLFAGALAGHAMGGSDDELLAAGLGGTALGAFAGAVLVSPDAPATTTGTVGAGRPSDLEPEECGPCNRGAVLPWLIQVNPQLG
jgi:hypothetical protein